MIGNDELVSTATNYRRFAMYEAQGRSPLYEELANGVAGDPEILSLLTSLPVPKRQPNLLLGVVRYLVGLASDYAEFRMFVLANWSIVSKAMLERRTQTNEVGRCATLLPFLLELPQPLALFEVGASAGLCLLFDHYRYNYGAGIIGPDDSPLTLECDLRGFSNRIPRQLPEIVWRAGLDIAPIDVRDERATGWLESLVWPGEGDRLARLQTALQIARADPPEVVQADVTAGLGDIVAGAPSEATLVIFHSAVLTYIPAEGRTAFVDEVMSIEAVWISNEGPAVLPASAQAINEHELRTHAADFLISNNGKAIAWADAHGSWVERRAN